MTFCPEDFYELGKKLKNDNNYIRFDEARKRTSASRVYYSLYLKLRDELLRYLLGSSVYPQLSEVAESGLMHSCLLEILKKVDLQSSYKFGSLQELRKKSDYEVDISVGDNEVEDAIAIYEELSRKIPDLLKRVSNDVDRKNSRVREVIQRYYERKHKRRKRKKNGWFN
ncbi:hypothetical protein [Geoglobus acetivorans]|uniref:hypothetical protein n=1 Tax=Geoglobus acetivorans TaxID=565033 RepID=UPI00064EA986